MIGCFNMSVFDKDIIKNESDIEREIRNEWIRTFMSKVTGAAHMINEKGKRAPSHYIVASEQMAKTLKNLW